MTSSWCHQMCTNGKVSYVTGTFWPDDVSIVADN